MIYTVCYDLHICTISYNLHRLYHMTYTISYDLHILYHMTYTRYILWLTHAIYPNLRVFYLICFCSLHLMWLRFIDIRLYGTLQQTNASYLNFAAIFTQNIVSQFTHLIRLLWSLLSLYWSSNLIKILSKVDRFYNIL